MGTSRVFGWLLGWLVYLWVRSLRLSVIDESGARESALPWVLVFFHGTQVPLLAWRRRRRTAVLVSWSRDGSLQSRVMERASMHVIRGSSSRGGARGLCAMVRALRSGGLDAAFAVDGPRGPYGAVHPGAAACARKVGGLLVPIGSASHPSHILRGAWDRMALPLPFARAVVVIGEPLAAVAAPSEISEAITTVNLRAAAYCAGFAGMLVRE
ncbi:MAG: lysophospholipid acyltransferase family protein [Polyangiales bacterium]